MQIITELTLIGRLKRKEYSGVFCDKRMSVSTLITKPTVRPVMTYDVEYRILRKQQVDKLHASEVIEVGWKFGNV